ncbi:MAG TPA: sulfotransferase [Caulobacteraceae bacterium]|jgi:Tfp pilus assembly protein PilF|nr:sulfotransferase [Caulobacteraceae bacterium]
MSRTDATAQPRSTEDALLQPALQAARAGDMAEAKRLARRAIAGGGQHPALFNLRAMDHEDNGRLDEALADLTRASELGPGDYSVLNALGLCLGRLGRPEEAVGRFEAALALRDDFAPAWFNLGGALEQLGETARAVNAYAKAAELAPGNALAWSNLAWLAARRGDRAAAESYARRALALRPGLPAAILTLAAVDEERPLAAEAMLRGLIGRPDIGAQEQALALGQLGDALDAQDRPHEAFEAYATGNAIARDEARPRFESPGRPTVQTTLAWLVPWAEALNAGVWRAGAEVAAEPGPPAAHVFLLGFPRSGTTLIESALAAHPDVVSLEERNSLTAAARDFTSDAAALSRLANAGPADLAFYRADYWQRVMASGVELAGKVFIDKNPFNTLRLPLIARLFPRARIIFAVRDPRDVVLSCFRRRFNLNPSTYELLDLRRAAAFYDGAMTFAEVMTPKLGLAGRRLIYERLVADFEGEARAVCAFIGVEWRPDLADFAGRARRGDVASASAAQIARGLYADGAGQWRRYRGELAPVLPVLAPWVRTFGYDPE